MSNDMRALGSIASIARVAKPGTGTFNDLYVFYYHVYTWELRYIIFHGGGQSPMQRHGTVNQDNKEIIKASINGTMLPLAATYDSSNDIINNWTYISVFYSDERSMVRDVLSDNGDQDWHAGTLENMSIITLDNHVLTAWFDAAADVIRLVFVDGNSLLYEARYDGGKWHANTVDD